MIKEARQQVLSGKFGKIRKVYVEYPQGWLSDFLEASDQKQASWRTDQSVAAKQVPMGDIGTCIQYMAEYVSGLQVTKICADINIVVEGRKLDDDGAAFSKNLIVEQPGFYLLLKIAAGEENNIKIRVYGEKGGVQWQQEDCNSLIVKWLDKPAEVWRAGTGYLSSYAKHNTRTPAGHPEGYLEAFANHYRNFAFVRPGSIEQRTTKTRVARLSRD